MIVKSVEKSLHQSAANSRKIWFDRCPPEVQKEALIVRKRFRDGKYAAYPVVFLVSALADEVEKHLPKRPSYDAVLRWLRKN